MNNKEIFIIHASASKSKNTDVYRKNLVILIFFRICDLVDQWEVVLVAASKFILCATRVSAVSVKM